MNRTISILVAVLFAGCATQGADELAPAPSARAASPASQSAASARPAPSASSLSSAARAERPAAPAPMLAPSVRSVYYEFDRTELRPDDVKVIEANARYLRESTGTKVRIEGNADERGSREYNLALGQRRAEGVARVLKLQGIGEDRMEAVSYGEERPRAAGHDESSWSQNRRSDIQYR